jgi:hypothetical protein
MKLVELEVFSDASNQAVIRPPGRRFPGSVVQGDSLSILCAEAKEISERIRALEVKDEELLYLAQDHQEALLGRLLHYQQVLAEHGISLPYGQAAQPSDLVVLVSEEEGNEGSADA